MSYPTATTSQPRSLSAAAGESGSAVAADGFEVTTKARMCRYSIRGTPAEQGSGLAGSREKSRGQRPKSSASPDRGEKVGGGAWRHAAQVQYSFLMDDFHCSFCGKRRREVRKLISGPRVFICDECVALCNDIIAKEEAAERPKYPRPREIYDELNT